MKKVLVLSVVAIAIFAVASFASLSLSGGGAVTLSYNSSPALSVSPSIGWLQLTSSSTDFSFTANVNGGSLVALYMTLPTPVKGLSVWAGNNNGGTGESLGGKGVGSASFGWASGNFVGLNYNSSNFNLYAESSFPATGLSLNSNVYADATFGPATIAVGGMNNFAQLYAAAKAGVGPATVYGMAEYVPSSSTLSNYGGGIAVTLGNYTLTAEANNAKTLQGWLDTTIGAYSVELGTTFNNFSQFSSAYAQASWSLTKDISAQANVTYSASAPNLNASLQLSVTF